jgi:hypothetical protein
MFTRKKRPMTKGSREVKGEWLQHEFDRLSLSGAAVGKKLGCDPTKIYNHLKDDTKLQAGLLAALWIEYPQLDMHYILTGLRRSDRSNLTDDARTAYEANRRILDQLGHSG